MWYNIIRKREIDNDSERICGNGRKRYNNHQRSDRAKGGRLVRLPGVESEKNHKGQKTRVYLRLGVDKIRPRWYNYFGGKGKTALGEKI